MSCISDHVPSLEPKLRFHNLGGSGNDQHHTAPVMNLDIDLSNYVKKPIFYIMWRPKEGRTDLKPSFEWGSFYNGVMTEALKVKGCVKYFNPDVDMIHWNPSQDLVSPFDKDDENYLE